MDHDFFGDLDSTRIAQLPSNEDLLLLPDIVPTMYNSGGFPPESAPLIFNSPASSQCVDDRMVDMACPILEVASPSPPERPHSYPTNQIPQPIYTNPNSQPLHEQQHIQSQSQPQPLQNVAPKSVASAKPVIATKPKRKRTPRKAQAAAAQTTTKPKKAASTKKKRKARSSRLDDATRNMTPEEAAEYKRQQRLLRNRASAQLSRERKKAYIDKLERQIEELGTENANLKEKVKMLEEVNRTLKEQLRLEGEAHSPSSSSSLHSVPSVSISSGDEYACSITSLENESFGDNSSLDGTISPHNQFSLAYDTFEPVSKRQRLNEDAVSNPLLNFGGPSSPIGRTAGVFLFAICFFSFAIFFSISGLNIGTHMTQSPLRSLTPHVPTFRGRVLNSVDTSNHIITAPPPPSSSSQTDHSLSQSTSNSLMTLPKSRIRDIKNSVVSSSSSGPANEYHRPLDTTDVQSLVKSLSEMMSKQNLDIASSSTSSSTPTITPSSTSSSSISATNPENLALDLYKGDGVDNQNTMELMNLHLQKSLMKLLMETNHTLKSDASYLFCPNAVQIFPTNQDGEFSVHVGHTGDPSNPSQQRSPYTKNGLPMPYGTGDINSKNKASKATNSSSSSTAPSLYLWIPSSSWSISGNNTKHGAKDEQLLEIACDVADVQPFSTQT